MLLLVRVLDFKTSQCNINVILLRIIFTSKRKRQQVKFSEMKIKASEIQNHLTIYSITFCDCNRVM